MCATARRTKVNYGVLLALLPTPTKESVREECENFDTDPSTQLTEEALRQLLKCVPNNTIVSDVLLKVVPLNKLYSTNIIDVQTVARHIALLNIDADLANAKGTLVDRIAQVTIGTKKRNNFSFATKYCSWHKPLEYAIWDANVDECLWGYKNRDGFATFKRQEISSTYASFLSIIDKFRKYYQLESFTLRELDKFLWQVGARLLAEKERQKKEREEKERQQAEAQAKEAH